MNRLFFLLLSLLPYNKLLIAQTPQSNISDTMKKTTHDTADATTSQRDLIDIVHWVLNKRKHPHLQKPKSKTEHAHFAFIPGGGYSLQTGVAVAAAANLVFFTTKNDESRPSTIQSSIAYTQHKQIIAPVAANIWSKNGKYNFISDIRYMNYPSQTFGLGAKSKVDNEYDIDFNNLRIHQSVLRKVTPNFFVGLGYYYDRFWDIKEINPPLSTVTSFQKYGLTATETVSGVNFQAVFDSRENTVNATQGIYASARYRINKALLGSDGNWEQGIFEIRKYITLPQNSKNTLAFWNYNWFTFAGKPPYLSLPSTGWDDFFNTGRGYLQGRYRARNMSYLEMEYRFSLSKNGLFGGVVFANAQTFSKSILQEYQTIIPGYGLGLRLKLNKHSATNLCLDYGFGLNGSRGIFINLGEVF